MCDHVDLSLEVEPHAYDDTPVRTLVIGAVRCKRCGMRFRFLGVDPRPSIKMPSSKDNHMQVILPILEEGAPAALAS